MSGIYSAAQRPKRAHSNPYHHEPVRSITPSFTRDSLRYLAVKRKTHPSLEVCIDPDSRGMTVSAALYTNYDRISAFHYAL
ncbi:MAG: hypothetical protein K2N35_04340 [Muribaculaceae bacterium]|nr:hypothetical protein [Muribaculaceae bacterium]